MKKITYTLAMALLFSVTACKSDKAVKESNTTNSTIETAKPDAVKSISPTEQQKMDTELINGYVKEKALTVETTPSGIQYIIEKEGNGQSPTIKDVVEVHYQGTLLDGTTFDSSYERKQPAKFPLRSVIRGWQEAIPLLKEGGKGKFIIPSHLAYGPRQVGEVIKANSVLIFDVELLDIVKQQ